VDGVDIFIFYLIILVLEISGNCVLVGAFCDFGDADTGKPVQIYTLFCDFEAFLGN